jgi:hypothetical protein
MIDDDGYEGPAQLINDGVTTEIEVTLRGHFDPISGSYSWYGRVAASDTVAELLANGPRRVQLRTPHGQAETALTDVDTWGRPRVEGFGTPPFAVLTDVPGESALEQSVGEG